MSLHGLSPNERQSSLDEGSASGSSKWRSLLGPLTQLQVPGSGSIRWDGVQQASKEEGTVKKAVPTLHNRTLSSKSESIVQARIQGLSNLESPLLRTLATRLAEKYGVWTPTNENKRPPHPYASLTVRDQWRKIQGSNLWEDLLDPINNILRAEIVRYGEFAQATYDAFDRNTDSKYYGSCKYTKDKLLEEVGLQNRGYEITEYIYATADLNFSKFFRKSRTVDAWCKHSNWMGFVAVCTSPVEIARLGRRDIVVAWRGTVTGFEWLEDIQGYLTPVDSEPGTGNQDVQVENGFWTIYKSSNDRSRYTNRSARDQVRTAVKDLVEKYKHEENLSITVTGHSLGSALATLCAYDIAQSKINESSLPKQWNPESSQSDPPTSQSDPATSRADPATFQSDPASSQANPVTAPATVAEKLGKKAEASQPGASGCQLPSGPIPITVFSFAGPRVGNRAFKERVKELGVAVLRVVNHNDLVTMVPGIIFTQQNLKPIMRLIPGWEHVGVDIKVDNEQSVYLRKSKSPWLLHNLEAYLHLVDGYHGTKEPFKTTQRDIALVNKGGNFLKQEYLIPGRWWQPEANKGLVRNNEGKWVIPKRDVDIFPPTPKLPEENTPEDEEIESKHFWRSLFIGAQKFKENAKASVAAHSAEEEEIESKHFFRRLFLGAQKSKANATVSVAAHSAEEEEIKSKHFFRRLIVGARESKENAAVSVAAHMAEEEEIESKHFYPSMFIDEQRSKENAEVSVAAHSADEEEEIKI